MPPFSPRRAVLYLRLSEADDASTSIARQERDLREYAEREGWDVVRILADDGLSGRKARDNADEALRMIADGEADALLVWKFDRWSRQGLAALAALLGVLDERPSAVFVAVRDGLTSTQPAWRIIASVLAEVARMEAENTAARVRSSIAALRRAHRWPGGTTPYGYRTAENPDGPGRVLVLDELEAAEVRAMADAVLSGASLYSIVKGLNDRKVPTRRAASWSIQAVKQLLASGVAAGFTKHHGEPIRDDSGLPAIVWPPIVTRAEQTALTEALKPTTGPARARRRSGSFLSGFAVCGSCGGTLSIKSNGQGLRSFACPSVSNGRPCEAPASVVVERAEEHAAATFLDLFGGLPESESVAVDDSEAAARLADLTAEADRVAASFATTEDPAEISRLASTLSALRTSAAEVRALMTAGPRLRVLRDTGRTVRDAWTAAESVDDRRRVLGNYLRAASVTRAASRRWDPTRLTYDWSVMPDAEESRRTT